MIHLNKFRNMLTRQKRSMSQKTHKNTKIGLIALVAVFVLLLISFILLSRKPLPCANSLSCAKNLSGKYDPTLTKGEYMGKSIPIPTDMFDQKIASPSVLGKSTPPGAKKIYVDLTNQKLYAYEGIRLIYGFTISSGKWNPTPVGKFYIWIKLLATNMEGGDKENNTYYNLPNVPYTMYFYNENVGKWNGYGIHGAYWPINFGQPATFGCVALSIKDAAKIYYWTDPAPAYPPTPVIIFGKAPFI